MTENVLNNLRFAAVNALDRLLGRHHLVADKAESADKAERADAAAAATQVVVAAGKAVVAGKGHQQADLSKQ